MGTIHGETAKMTYHSQKTGQKLVVTSSTGTAGLFIFLHLKPEMKGSEMEKTMSQCPKYAELMREMRSKKFV